MLPRLKGDASDPGPFRYRDKGTMATIGRGRAVAETGGLRLSGYIAWLAWLFVHIMYLTEFLDRFATRVTQLGNILGSVSPIADAAPSEPPTA